ncbi:MAG: hypothetical protein ABIR81_12410 [Ginsengibacter sp.]
MKTSRQVIKMGNATTKCKHTNDNDYHQNGLVKKAENQEATG